MFQLNNEKKRKKGSVLLFVVCIFLFVLLFSSLALKNLSQAIYQTNIYGIQMQQYYLNREAVEVIVAVLRADDNDLLENFDNPRQERLTHSDDDGNYLGYSTIYLQKVKADYYGQDLDWIKATITTYTVDKRASSDGDLLEYVGELMVLVKNPIVQLYNKS